MTTVLCVGHAVLDFVFEVVTFPTTAEKFAAEGASIVGGGCAANAAVAVSRLGGTALLAAQLGDDPVGRLIVDDLAAEGVDVSGVTQQAGARSSYSSVLVDRSGDRQIVNFRGTPGTIETSWFNGIEGLSAVLTDTRRPAAALAALEVARAEGVAGILDGEAPVPPDLLVAASHVAFSRQGLSSLYPDKPAEAALAQFAAEHDAWACVTDGALGVWYLQNSQVAHCPAFEVDVQDTLGAGDIWHGAFAWALGSDMGEVEAIRVANGAAALKCMVPGGRSGAPSLEALTSFLATRT